MLNLYFVYNGHCQFFLGTFNNVDDLIERMEDHQWAFSAITHLCCFTHVLPRSMSPDFERDGCRQVH